jgi:lambda repressor-like predicted transcriptional regulator
MANALHKEDIKAGLRKRFGSLVKFEKTTGRPHGSVKDVLRGRASAETEEAIAAALKEPLHRLFPRRYAAPDGCDLSTKVDDSGVQSAPHRLSAGAR